MDPQEFASNYIAHELPWTAIDFNWDDEHDIPAPFRKLVLERDFLGTNELRLRDEIRGRASAHAKRLNYIGYGMDSLIKAEPSAAQITNLIDLYRRARIWCETNQRAVQLQKDPQPGRVDTTVLAGTFSKLHQEATKGVKKWVEEQLDHDKTPEEVQAQAHKPTEPELEPGFVPEPSESEFSQKLRDIFGDITPLKPQTAAVPTTQDRTQYELIITDPAVIDAMSRHRPPKPFWKKNRYPVQTKREVIAERRKLARALTAEEMELDYLPGIWEQPLLVNEFRVTGRDHDGRVLDEEDKDERYEPVSWYDKQACNEKCSEWLSSIKE